MTKKKTTKKKSTRKSVVSPKEEEVPDQISQTTDVSIDPAPDEDEHWREKEAEKLSNQIAELEKKIVQVETKKKEIQDSLKSHKSQRDLALQNLRELFDPSMKTLWDEKRDREARALKDTTPIGELDVTPKIINALTAAGIKTIGALRSFDKPLSDIAGIGDKARRQIEDAIKARDEAARNKVEPPLPYDEVEQDDPVIVSQEGVISLPAGLNDNDLDYDDTEFLNELYPGKEYLKVVSILEEQRIETVGDLMAQIKKGRKFEGINSKDLKSKITLKGVIELADVISDVLQLDLYYNAELHEVKSQYDVLRQIDNPDIRQKINDKLLKYAGGGFKCSHFIGPNRLEVIMESAKLTKEEKKILRKAADDYCVEYFIPYSRR